mmetsp:Transcript_43165/g.104405  ORF Transcript_43165/g.104405 Transcript_43165/m.104405 type:complete len:143 (+) Transcript_43165:76-504(+)|eukprot:CAMPEP_0113645452 /NCGR_PEP_ID=MMETSP0017_2-20120614/23962_1 /TAXON_ID=2856 /ORGANISM="Cylindrotheca closterium" /LENGTH=142 /DNA_ID=CAMNT_0000557197 /DNA_START=49 /DNA_END=477 /DNA_ORIENTATION=+ /assembly_acc=CAM_ASM_000147
MKLLLLILPTLASSFSVSPLSGTVSTTFLRADASEEDEGLVLDGLDNKMSEFRTEYSFTEADYLAAARKRAEERKASVNSGASDEDWQKIADEKESQVGKIDDWENAVKEAGNSDSQILMFTEPPADAKGEEGKGDDKLLLF